MKKQNDEKIMVEENEKEEFIESVLEELSKQEYSCWDSGCRLGGKGGGRELDENNYSI